MITARVQLAAVLAAVIAGAGGCASDRPVDETGRPRQEIRLATGPAGGGFAFLGEQIAEALRPLLPAFEIRTVASTGAIANIELIQSGQADLAFTFADVAYLGFSGQPGASAPAFDRSRGIAVLQLMPVALVARADTTIRGPADLRGRRVNLGPVGSGTALTANLILRAFGLAEGAVHTETIALRDAVTRLLDGTLDAMFNNSASQADTVKEAIDMGARLVPIDGPPVDRLRREYPFLRPTTIPGNYPKGGGSIHTIGVDGVLICGRDLDEGVVYEVTRQFFAGLQSLAASGALSLMDLDQAPATPIPLHRGAARYYRERELSR